MGSSQVGGFDGRSRADARSVAGDDGTGHVGESEVVAAGVVAQGGEGLLHVEALVFGDHALGLLDHDAAVEGFLSCSLRSWVSSGGPVLQDGDGGDVGESLSRFDDPPAATCLVDVEQVERTDARCCEAAWAVRAPSGSPAASAAGTNRGHRGR